MIVSRLEPILLRGVTLDWTRSYVMGIVNVTPDSFSDGGAYFDPQEAVRHGVQLVSQGVDILDVGGESSRPGASPVGAAQEIDRVLPVIEALAKETLVPISIDTTKAKVAKAAIAAGAEMVNDISGGCFDPEMYNIVASASAVYVCGHVNGTTIAEVHQQRAGAITPELVVGELKQRVAGLPPVLRYRTIVDPGLGFGKRPPENIALCRQVGAIASALRCPVLVGPSRKRFLAALVGQTMEAKDAATVGAGLACVRFGANIVRVHNVAMMQAALRAFEAIQEQGAQK